MLDISFADIAVESGYIGRNELESILDNRTDFSESVPDLLVRLKKMTPKEGARCRAKQLGVPFVDLSKMDLIVADARSLPHAMAVQLNAIPIERSESAATIAMADPLDLDAIDEIHDAMGLEIDPVMATREDIQEAILKVFGRRDDLADLVREAGMSAEVEDTDGIRDARLGPSVTLDLDDPEAPPIIRLTNAIISKAILMRASDVHFEPQSRSVRVRLRIDGLLQEIMSVPKEIQQMLTSRLKILAGLDIAERRVPQDGRFSLNHEHADYDFRVSSYPSIHGESIVMRILDRRSDIVRLDRLGVDETSMTRTLAALDEPQGMILVTGPTGSGKTTTLYAGLNHLNTQHRNIITIEDPVEYQLEGITQATINPKAGVTFASGLRSILRQDPDVILVGEIRDIETAGIAVEAALTGHLVMTSLHANDSAAALTRLVDMAVEPLLIASSVTASIAQRLVRINCRFCEAEYRPDPEVLEKLGISPSHRFFRGLGCEKCGKTGYWGRQGVFEVLEMTPEIRKLIQAGADSAAIKEAAISHGLKPLRTQAIQKVLDGLTTPEEVIRVTTGN